MAVLWIRMALLAVTLNEACSTALFFPFTLIIFFSYFFFFPFLCWRFTHSLSSFSPTLYLSSSSLSFLCMFVPFLCSLFSSATGVSFFQTITWTAKQTPACLPGFLSCLFFWLTSSVYSLILCKTLVWSCAELQQNRLGSCRWVNPNQGFMADWGIFCQQTEEEQSSASLCSLLWRWTFLRLILRESTKGLPQSSYILLPLQTPSYKC